MGNQSQQYDNKLSPHLNIISNTPSTEPTIIRSAFDTFLPLLPQNLENISTITEIAHNFSISQIQTFSNNWIAYMQEQMSQKISTLNITANLLHIFTVSVYKKYKTVRDILSYPFNDIIDKTNPNLKPDVILKTSFPYNVLIFTVSSWTNEEFLYKTDIFHKELDKFKYVSKITETLFFVIHSQDIPLSVNTWAWSSIEYLDTFKWFVFNFKEWGYIPVKAQELLITKVYNSSMHNLENLLNSRVDNNIPLDKFEYYLYMNFYILAYFCCDINHCLVTDKAVNTNALNTFNWKVVKIFTELIAQQGYQPGESNENVTTKVIEGYIVNIENTWKTNFLQTSQLLKKFLIDYFTNSYRLGQQYQIWVKIIILYIFETAPDICEEICLSKDLLTLILDSISYTNAFDVMMLYLLTKADNFYIMLKHLNRKVLDYVSNCITNVINNRAVEKKKFTYSVYFSLLVVKTITGKINDITHEIQDIIVNNYFSTLAKAEISMENIFDNWICLSCYFDIWINQITHLDPPSHLIYSLLKKQKEFKLCYEKYSWFYKNNFEFEAKGRKVWTWYNEWHWAMEKFVLKVEEMVGKEGEHVEYSMESKIIGIINKVVYKNEEFVPNRLGFMIFGSDVVKYLVSTGRSWTEFKIVG